MPSQTSGILSTTLLPTGASGAMLLRNEVKLKATNSLAQEK